MEDLNYVLKDFTELDTATLYDILRLRAEIFIVEQNCVYQDVDDKDQAAQHLLMFQNKLLIGYCRLIPPGLTFAEDCISRVCVAETQRRKGLAFQLMKEAIQKLVGLPIRISAQKYLIDFYKSLDFTIVSEPYLEDGIPHVEMLRL